jgi:disulfide bond formation protein DsbB
MISAGSNSFQTICAACHGFNARGIPGLGKDLLASEFVDSLTDEELLHFIIVGRDASDPLNTTGVLMPARGGNLAVTDEQILNIIAYLRSEAVGSAEAAQPTAVPTQVAVAAQPTATLVPQQPTATLVPQQSPTPAPTREPVTPQPFSAESAFVWSCAGCHGGDGNGNEPYGPGFMESELLDDRAALLAFLTESKPPVDPAVEYPHPVRGGYPVLSDEQLSELIEYMEGLRTEAAGS